MRKAALLNAPITSTVARMGHTDSVCISDAGLPVPDGVKRIDLAVIKGLPLFLEVLDAVTGEICVESVTIAREMADNQPDFHSEVRARIAALEVAQRAPIPVDVVPHEDFKRRTGHCKAVIRTGEATPFANIILHAGVTF